MEENIMEMTNEVVEVADAAEEITEAVVETKGGLRKKVLTGIGVGIACAVGTLLVKNRDKIKERKLKKQIAKLEKEGFVVLNQSDIEELGEIDDLPVESEE